VTATIDYVSHREYLDDESEDSVISCEVHAVFKSDFVVVALVMAMKVMAVIAAIAKLSCLAVLLVPSGGIILYAKYFVAWFRHWVPPPQLPCVVLWQWKRT
jgi:hypothetical protein